MASLGALPEELQLLIIDFLDVPSPSSQRLRLEPSLALTDSEDCTLKNVSLISKHWRRLVLPTLFKCTRLRLDAPIRPEWNSCVICNHDALSNGTETHPDLSASPEVDQYHADMVATGLTICNANIRAGQADNETQQTGDIAFAAGERLRASTVLAWIPRFYHGLRDFVDYIQKHDLVAAVDSFILYTDQMLEEKLHRFPHEAADKDWRFSASAAFWAHLLAVIDPSTITILAPPTDLACLTNCAIDATGDWAFDDMDYHIISIQHPRCNWSSSKPSQVLPTFDSLRPIPDTYPSIAPSSILALRPWTHLSLNEGPFLKAYGTYEFFERGPPSLVYSIKESIIRNHPDPASLHSTSSKVTATRPLPALTSIDYTAIFPFANHADFSPILHQITHLSMQLAPHPTSNILNDRARLGKADLADCWIELLTTYADLVEPLKSARRPLAVSNAGADPYSGEFTWDTSLRGVAVQRLEALDFSIKAMRKELDELFVPLCLPVWVEAEMGVFTRYFSQD